MKRRKKNEKRLLGRKFNNTILVSLTLGNGVNF